MREKKKFVVIAFAILTVLLAGLAVVISIRLVQDQAARDAAAATYSGQRIQINGGKYQICDGIWTGGDTCTPASSICDQAGGEPLYLGDGCGFWKDYSGSQWGQAHCDIANLWNYYECNPSSCSLVPCNQNVGQNNLSKDEAYNKLNGLKNSCTQARAQIDCYKIEGGSIVQGEFARTDAGLSKFCTNPSACGPEPEPPISTPSSTVSSTTSQPPANVCKALRRTAPTGTTPIDVSTDTGYVVANGTQMRFRAKFTCLNGLKDKFKLVVFEDGNRFTMVGTPNTPVSWRPDISGINDGGDCLYFYDWTATGLQAGKTYKVRVVNIGNDNVWNTGDDIEGDPDCKKDLTLQAVSSTTTSVPTSSSTPTSTISSSTPSSTPSSESTPSSAPSASSSTTSTPGGTLPSTGIFDDNGGAILLGGALVLLGILFNRYNVILRGLGYDDLATRIFGHTEETYAEGVEKSVRVGTKKSKKRK